MIQISDANLALINRLCDMTECIVFVIMIFLYSFCFIHLLEKKSVKKKEKKEIKRKKRKKNLKKEKKMKKRKTYKYKWLVILSHNVVIVRSYIFF